MVMVSDMQFKYTIVIPWFTALSKQSTERALKVLLLESLMSLSSNHTEFNLLF